MTLNVIMRTSRANDLPSSSAWHICHAASDIQDRLSDGHVSDTVNFFIFYLYGCLRKRRGLWVSHGVSHHIGNGISYDMR